MNVNGHVIESTLEPIMETEDFYSDEGSLESGRPSKPENRIQNLLKLPKDLPPPRIQIPPRRRRKVKFSNIEIRSYGVTYSDNPCCREGPPIGLDWQYTSTETLNINVFEANRLKRRRLRDLVLNPYQRRDKLITIAGLSLKEIDLITREVSKARRQRAMTKSFMAVSMMGEAFASFGDRLTGIYFREGKSDEKKDVSGRECESIFNDELFKNNSMAKLKRLKMDMLDISRSGSSATAFDSNSSDMFEVTVNDPQRQYTSADSDFLRYDVMIDRSQSDKALQIKLCSLKRPHMRAFHASWFSFFVAFFSWFAITPLLSEVQDTLGLSDREIWTSSLSGSASTIVFRILMGPACDKFGARLCMAAILLTSAIPTAMTGFVNTSVGLSVVRAFIGIAGSSFVACQYWTSSMFTKEIAGTANALVAGWGNLGGGMAQIMIGSVFFPIFKFIYKFESSAAIRSSLAWRTVFIIPAIVSFATGLFILFYCDDLPKGNIRKRTRQRELLEVSSISSLRTVLKSRTAWVLFFQYAGCFGIEVTMTNAVAKFFKDEYDLSTETSAAIASTFGFMNIFARGLGGFASDKFNVKLGINGRVTWQFIVLFVEGCGVLWFSFARSMAMSILALIFTSLCVQFSEGSTFGIVPYVNRRYTGGVVGFVAAGGNAGGVLFAFLFHQYGNRSSFFYMGISAMVVSFLSFFLKIKKDAFFHNAEVVRVLLADPEDRLCLPVSERK